MKYITLLSWADDMARGLGNAFLKALLYGFIISVIFALVVVFVKILLHRSSGTSGNKKSIWYWIIIFIIVLMSIFLL